MAKGPFCQEEIEKVKKAIDDWRQDKNLSWENAAVLLGPEQSKKTRAWPVIREKSGLSSERTAKAFIACGRDKVLAPQTGVS